MKNLLKEQEVRKQGILTHPPYCCSQAQKLHESGFHEAGLYTRCVALNSYFGCIYGPIFHFPFLQKQPSVKGKDGFVIYSCISRSSVGKYYWESQERLATLWSDLQNNIFKKYWFYSFWSLKKIQAKFSA